MELIDKDRRVNLRELLGLMKLCRPLMEVSRRNGELAAAIQVANTQNDAGAIRLLSLLVTQLLNVEEYGLHRALAYFLDGYVDGKGADHVQGLLMRLSSEQRGYAAKIADRLRKEQDANDVLENRLMKEFG
jgi:hypothetical protein